MQINDIKGAKPEIAYMTTQKNYKRDTLDTKDINKQRRMSRQYPTNLLNPDYVTRSVQLNDIFK